MLKRTIFIWVSLAGVRREMQERLSPAKAVKFTDGVDDSRRGPEDDLADVARSAPAPPPTSSGSAISHISISVFWPDTEDITDSRRSFVPWQIAFDCAIL